MRNPYKLYKGEPLENIILKAIIFPGAPLAHLHQLNRECNPPLKSKIKNYVHASFGEGLKLVVYGMLIHNMCELYQKYVSQFLE